MGRGKLHRKNRIRKTMRSGLRSAVTLGFSVLLFGCYITLTIETKAVEPREAVPQAMAAAKEPEEAAPQAAAEEPGEAKPQAAASEKEADHSGEAPEPANPEAEAADDIDKYSADEILAHYDPADLEVSGEMGGEVSGDGWNLLLVNSRHPIPEDYEFTLGTIRGSLQCDERIIPEFLSMLQAAKQDGISLEVCSPYRSLGRQEYLFERKIVRYMDKGMSYMEAYKLAARVVNVPGSSEHQIGLALDIYTNSYTTLDEGFGETEAGIWLKEHCSEYGFILRYPKGKEYITGIEYEPWHFRYVGKTAAREIMERDLTLEEYVESL